MPRHPKPQGQRGLRMWNPNPKYPPSIRIEKKLEGCTPGMILDLNACNNCPKKIKHWQLEINRGGCNNGDFVEGNVFIGYPILPDLHDDQKDVETIQDDDCCVILAKADTSEYTHGHGLLPHKWFLANGNKILDEKEFEVVNCPMFEKHVKYTETHPRGSTFDYRYEFPKLYDKLAYWFGNSCFDTIEHDCFYMKYCLNIKMPYLRAYIWNMFVHLFLFLLMTPYIIKYMMFGGDPPKWAEWILDNCVKKLNTKDYYKEE